jgi:hypothetical protein
MPKFAPLPTVEEGIVEYYFECPGCGYSHWVRTCGPRPLWQFNDDLERPTVTPSVHVGPGSQSSCHSFITGGRIRFLDDCWHALAGQTVELPELDG